MTDAAKRAMYGSWNRHLEAVRSRTVQKVEAVRATGVRIPAGDIRRQRALASIPVVLPTFLSQLRNSDTVAVALPNTGIKFTASLMTSGELVVVTDRKLLPSHELEQHGFVADADSDSAYLFTEGSLSDSTVRRATDSIYELFQSGMKLGPSTMLSIRYMTQSDESKAALAAALENPASASPLAIHAPAPTKNGSDNEPARVGVDEARSAKGPKRTMALVVAAIAAAVLAVFLARGTSEPDYSEVPAAAPSTSAEPDAGSVSSAEPSPAVDDLDEADPDPEEPTFEAEPPAPQTQIPDDSEQAIAFAVALQDIDPTYASMSRSELVALGSDVCYLLSAGETQESAIDAYTTLYEGDPMTVARLVVAADTYLC